jgi:hypothetical protein
MALIGGKFDERPAVSALTKFPSCDGLTLT